MPGIVSTIHTSINRFCADFAAEHGLSFVNFDAHADETTVPPGDVVGPMGVSWEVDEGMVEINLMIGISTVDDTNLFRLAEKIGYLFERVLPTQRIKAYDSEYGDEIGEFVVRNGTRALPVGGSQSRPIQHIMVGLASTLTFVL